jgi:resuscitation-promoting factor RpfC
MSPTRIAVILAPLAILVSFLFSSPASASLPPISHDGAPVSYTRAITDLKIHSSAAREDRAYRAWRAARARARRKALAEAAAAQLPPAPPAPVPVSPADPGSFQACVIQAESGGDPTAVNPSSGAGGLYGFLPSTWHALGFPGLPEDASVAMQNEAFAKEYALDGTAPWAPYDGC